MMLLLLGYMRPIPLPELQRPCRHPPLARHPLLDLRTFYRADRRKRDGGHEERADAFEVEGMRAWSDEGGLTDGDTKKT